MGHMKNYWLLLLVLLIPAASLALPQPEGGLPVNTFIFIAFAFLFTFAVGGLLERINVPWIFAALLLGAILAVYNPVGHITSSETFTFLAQLGMYFLLFIIGFEIDLGKIRKMGGFIMKSTFFIIFLEGAAGSVFIHFVFGYDWIISFIVALSFATVGEAILVPILHKFNMVNTRLGQVIMGVGTLDDIIEVATLILAVFLVGSGSHAGIDITVVLLSLLAIFALAYGLTRLGREGRRFGFYDLESLFLFTIAVLFLFLGVGDYADTAPLGALMAGVALGNFIPAERKALMDRELTAVCYGLFAPIFFIWAGSTLDIGYLASFPLAVIGLTLLSNGVKLIGSYIMGHRELGTRQSVLLGIALSVRFSTSIIVIKILLDNSLIGTDLYSVILASSIAFKFIVPPLLSNLLSRWGAGDAPQKKRGGGRPRKFK